MAVATSQVKTSGIGYPHEASPVSPAGPSGSSSTAVWPPIHTSNDARANACSGNQHHENQPDEKTSGREEGTHQVRGCLGRSNAEQQQAKQEYERHCVRTVLIMAIPDGTTYEDVTSAVRGGMLLDIFLRMRECTAQVSFLRALDAQNFVDHVKKHDLYIKGKRVRP